MAINPIKNVFHCKKADKGGSILDFVMHLSGGTVKDAAQFLLENHDAKTQRQVKKTAPPKNEERTKKVDNHLTIESFQPLSHLVYEHDLVQDLGISAQDAEALGIGYTSRGLLKGHVCVPVRLPDGTLAGYVGILEGKVPQTWHYPKTNVVPITKAKKRA